METNNEKMMLYDYDIKFKGYRLDNGEEVIGDLVRKLARQGGQWHCIYVDGEDLEDEGEEYTVDFATIEILLKKK